MENFTPVSALIGGALIGLSASILLLFTGRMAGVSGIMEGVLSHAGRERIWRLLFLLGLIIGAFLYQLSNPSFFTPRDGYPVWLLIVGGILVGFGTRMGRGCTSGHGICGIANFSIRSIYATLIFMATGIATVYVLRHLLGVVT